MEQESDPQDSGSVNRPIEPDDPNGPILIGRTYQSNTVNLSTDGKEICAMIGPNPVQGIAGRIGARSPAGSCGHAGGVGHLDRSHRSEPSVAGDAVQTDRISNDPLPVLNGKRLPEAGRVIY